MNTNYTIEATCSDAQGRMILLMVPDVHLNALLAKHGFTLSSFSEAGVGYVLDLTHIATNMACELRGTTVVDDGYLFKEDPSLLNLHFSGTSIKTAEDGIRLMAEISARTGGLVIDRGYLTLAEAPIGARVKLVVDGLGAVNDVMKKLMERRGMYHLPNLWSQVAGETGTWFSEMKGDWARSMKFWHVAGESVEFDANTVMGLSPFKSADDMLAETLGWSW